MPSVASLERQIALLEKKVDLLIEMVAGLAPKKQERDHSILGFCERHSISRSTYHNLRRAGKAPVETAAGQRRRTITEEAEAEWIAARQAEAAAISEQRNIIHEASRIEKTRRVAPWHRNGSQ